MTRTISPGWDSKAKRIAVRLAFACAAMSLATSGNSLSAAEPSPAATPNLSGFWLHMFDPKTDVRTETGNFTEGFVPEPVLTAAGRARRDAARKLASGEAITSDTVVPSASRWCLPLPYPFFMRSAEGFDLIQGRHEVMITGDRPMAMRHIYLDQTMHPKDWAPTIMGHAIGHWEGGTLVADSVGFVYGSIPNVGQVTPQTHLVERYRLLANGKLAVRFTWDDPTLLAKPLSYEWYYDRQPSETFSVEDWCDASDPRQIREPYGAGAGKP